MHEFSLMADLFRKIDEISRTHDNGKVVVVRVKLGALSHITPDHFSEHFVEFSKGTPAEGAKLEVEQLEDANDPQAQDILLDSVELAA
ncbi:MAG: hydrogenase maturation nickel metallochaperone HypA [Alphaproteobacteria bacterium]|nr:hydrogenase maturation nickel metallochaperone HypA [Alphaproteobacteria bacterium]